MKTANYPFLIAAVAAISIHSLGDARPAPKADPLAGQAPAAATQPRLVQGYGVEPMHFEANQGQTHPEVKFLARGPGYGLFLTRDEAVLVLRKGEGAKQEMRGRDKTSFGRFAPQPPPTVGSQPPSVLRMKLVGANVKPTVEGVGELPGKANYLRGNEPKQWQTGVATYAKVRYEQVYPGVDLVFYGCDQRHLEYDFVVSPGANPKAIELAYTGAERMEIAENGDLVLHMNGGTVRQPKPLVYQQVSGCRQAIGACYTLVPPRPDSENGALPHVRLALADYDASAPLVIDPTLEYCTYLGGTSDEVCWGYAGHTKIAVDGAGSAYILGNTLSLDFPTVNAMESENTCTSAGTPDGFVTKLDTHGAVVYSTYLGSCGWAAAIGIAIGPDGSAYIANLIDWNIYVIKLSPSGADILYSTYIGHGLYWGDIAVDSSGQAYVTGAMLGMAIVNGYQSNFAGPAGGWGDAFVAKLSADGSELLYSTYLGGTEGECGYGIAVDTAGRAHIVGWTQSLDFPLKNSLGFAGSDWNSAFLASIDTTTIGEDSLRWSTFFGVFACASDVALDSNGDLLILGTGYLAPTPDAYQLPCQWPPGNWISKLRADGPSIVFSLNLPNFRTRLFNPVSRERWGIWRESRRGVVRARREPNGSVFESCAYCTWFLDSSSGHDRLRRWPG